MSRPRLLGALVLAGALLFALGGGEYGTLDWLDLRRQEQAERRAIESLTTEVDSLRRYAKAVERDRAVMERIAREDFGMIRQGEFLYRLGVDSLDGEEGR